MSTKFGICSVPEDVRNCFICLVVIFSSPGWFALDLRIVSMISGFRIGAIIVSMTAESVRRCVSLKRFGAVVIVSKMVSWEVCSKV